MTTTNEHQTLMSRCLLDVFNRRNPKHRAAAVCEATAPTSPPSRRMPPLPGPQRCQEQVQQLLDGSLGSLDGGQLEADT
jgi:hypothetical protein